MAKFCAYSVDDKGAELFVSGVDNALKASLNMESGAAKVESKIHGSGDFYNRALDIPTSRDNLWGRVKSFFRSFTTDEAAVMDIMKDNFDPFKTKSRWDLIYSNYHKGVVAPLKGKKINDANGKYADKLSFYRDYRKSREILTRMRNGGEQAILESKAYKGWLSQKGNSGKGVSDYIKYWEDAHENFKVVVGHDNDLSEANAYLENETKRLYNELKAVDPQAHEALVESGFGDHLDVLDGLNSRFSDAKFSDQIKQIFKQVYGVDVDLTNANEQYKDSVSMMVLDKMVKQAHLKKYVMDSEVNQQFMDALESVSGEVPAIDSEYIKTLKDNDPLKLLWNDALKEVTKDKYSRDVFLRSKKATTLERIKEANMWMAAKKVVSDNTFLMNKSIKNIIDANKGELNNLYRVINMKDFDPSLLPGEIEELSKKIGKTLNLESSSLNDALLNIEMNKRLDKEVNSRKIGNAENIMETFADMFPNHSIVTSTGTRIFTSGQKIGDIKDNKEVLGSVVDLTNQKMIVSDVINMKSILDLGADNLKDKLLSGRISVVPNEKAELLSKYKYEATKNVSNFGLNKVNKVFTMATLFAPWNLVGYQQTQWLGNVSWTIMGDVTAFKKWPSFIKELRNAWAGDYNKIENPDRRRIIELLTTSEGSSIFNLAAEDFKMFEDPLFVTAMKEAQNGNKKSMLSLVKKMTKTSTKWVSLVEMISRGAMAETILEKQRAGKQYAPVTSNKYRVDHLWDIDPHTAAVRMANDSHIDYQNLPTWVREAGRWFPFLSFKVGSSMVMGRQFNNIYREVRNAFSTGDWTLAKSYMGKGAISVLWRAGIAATIFMAVQQALGLISDDQRKANNARANSNIFNKMFKSIGINLDNNISIPGTGFTPLDKLLRIGKSHIIQKQDTFADAESMIPFLDENWRKDGMKGAVQFASGKIASSMSPLIKTPVELMMGGGTIWETGYRANPDWQTYPETIINKISPFVGLGSLTRGMFAQMHGNPNDIRSDSAYAVNYWSRRLQQTKDNTDYLGRRAIGDRMYRMDIDGTLEAIRSYEYKLQKKGIPQSEIESKIKKAIEYYSITEKIKRNPEMIKNLTAAERKELQSTIEAQNDFFRAIGYGRW